MMEAAVVVVLEQLPSSLMMRDCSNRHHCRRRKPEHFLKPLNPTLWKWENCSPTSIENSSTAESPPISTTVCNIAGFNILFKRMKRIVFQTWERRWTWFSIGLSTLTLAGIPLVKTCQWPQWHLHHGLSWLPFFRPYRGIWPTTLQ